MPTSAGTLTRRSPSWSNSRSSSPRGLKSRRKCHWVENKKICPCVLSVQVYANSFTCTIPRMVNWSIDPGTGDTIGGSLLVRLWSQRWCHCVPLSHGCNMCGSQPLVKAPCCSWSRLWKCPLKKGRHQCALYGLCLTGWRSLCAGFVVLATGALNLSTLRLLSVCLLEALELCSTWSVSITCRCVVCNCYIFYGFHVRFGSWTVGHPTVYAMSHRAHTEQLCLWCAM